MAPEKFDEMIAEFLKDGLTVVDGPSKQTMSLAQYEPDRLKAGDVIAFDVLAKCFGGKKGKVPLHMVGSERLQSGSDHWCVHGLIENSAIREKFIARNLPLMVEIEYDSRHKTGLMRLMR